LGGVVAVDVDRVYKTPTQRERFVTAFRSAPCRLFADESGAHDLYADDADAIGHFEIQVSDAGAGASRQAGTTWRSGDPSFSRSWNQC